jgi:hypothetical protein
MTFSMMLSLALGVEFMAEGLLEMGPDGWYSIHYAWYLGVYSARVSWLHLNEASIRFDHFLDSDISLKRLIGGFKDISEVLHIDIVKIVSQVIAVSNN